MIDPLLLVCLAPGIGMFLLWCLCVWEDVWNNRLLIKIAARLRLCDAVWVELNRDATILTREVLLRRASRNPFGGYLIRRPESFGGVMTLEPDGTGTDHIHRRLNWTPYRVRRKFLNWRQRVRTMPCRRIA